MISLIVKILFNNYVKKLQEKETSKKILYKNNINTSEKRYNKFDFNPNVRYLNE